MVNNFLIHDSYKILSDLKNSKTERIVSIKRDVFYRNPLRKSPWIPHKAED
ncbi:hypothetical protein LEP1GSC193_1116 [Leptospira alstonii serovar Pingchang str. 80-412]|uniref:Uncharacterized protein n=1 Tax=Leptospira alstonii serovar Pingchang str. 80-412 TaxID=1218564 RepID=T0G6T7_9LEPT|nr:hypothetical protein LEP1GSC193_1116 [Leptospira alstonii serovar Pingchang str. 80-412]